MGSHTSLLFAFVGFLELLFAATSVPDSRGRTLEDLDEQFVATYSTV